MIATRFDYEQAKQAIREMEISLAEYTNMNQSRPWLAGARRESVAFHLTRLRDQVREYELSHLAEGDAA